MAQNDKGMLKTHRVRLMQDKPGLRLQNWAVWLENHLTLRKYSLHIFQMLLLVLSYTRTNPPVRHKPFLVTKHDYLI